MPLRARARVAAALAALGAGLAAAAALAASGRPVAGTALAATLVALALPVALEAALRWWRPTPCPSAATSEVMACLHTYSEVYGWELRPSIALAIAILVLGSFVRDVVGHAMDFQFFQMQRHDMNVALVEPTASTVLHELRAIPGVMAAEGVSDFQKAVATAMTSVFGVGGARFHTGGAAGPADTVYLGVFRREVLEQLGGYDESFLRAQDWELNHRIRSAGHVVWFTPELSVTYRPRSTLRALGRQYFHYGRWRRVVMRQHPGTANARYLAPPVVVLACSAGLLAAPVFASSVIAMPLLLDRPVSVLTAVLTSWRVVMANPLPMAAWGAIIMLLTLVGMATALLGLIVLMPLLGHASWHAYRDLVKDAA